MAILDGKVAVVTGGGRGIGRATATLLAEHGARVLINDLDADVAQQASDEIAGETLAFPGNLAEPDVPDRMIAAAVGAWGQLDIVVNNAGYSWDGVIHKMSDEQFQAMLDIHTIAPFRVLRAAAPHLREPAKKEREEGREVFRKVVNVSSISGVTGQPGQVNYAAAKAAVIGLTKTLAKEWGQFKINVNAVSFGSVETRMTGPNDESNVIDIDGRRIQLGMPPEMRAGEPSLISLGRAATPEEAAGGIFLLCTPWSNFVQGQVLNVNGGQRS